MSIASKGSERRSFPRIEYRAFATLITSQKKWPVHVLDVSFNGALAALLSDNDLQLGEQIILTIEVEGGTNIKMQGHLAHQKGHFMGLECHATNIDHQSHLRDLLNKHKADAHHHRSVNELIEDYNREQQDN
jgi:gamma-glutamyl-gamma-aminobutyrate hydrolase PuuD